MSPVDLPHNLQLEEADSRLPERFRSKTHIDASIVGEIGTYYGSVVNMHRDFAAELMRRAEEHDVLVWALAQLVDGWDQNKPITPYKELIEKVRPVLKRNLKR